MSAARKKQPRKTPPKLIGREGDPLPQVKRHFHAGALSPQLVLTVGQRDIRSKLSRFAVDPMHDSQTREDEDQPSGSGCVPVANDAASMLQTVPEALE